eukprot:symbB.v1.2.032551.t1/scaffold3922.1/size48298/3
MSFESTANDTGYQCLLHAHLSRRPMRHLPTFFLPAHKRQMSCSGLLHRRPVSRPSPMLAWLYLDGLMQSWSYLRRWSVARLQRILWMRFGTGWQHLSDWHEVCHSRSTSQWLGWLHASKMRRAKSWRGIETCQLRPFNI